MIDTKPENWTKRDRIVYLLDHWQDIFYTAGTNSSPLLLSASSGSSESHSHPPLPAMAHDRSVKKIERALTVLADREPVLARHLKAYRTNAEWRCLDTIRVVKLPSGKRDIVPDRIRQRIVLRWVDLKKVALAETILMNFIHGDVSIPRDLWLALTKP